MNYNIAMATGSEAIRKPFVEDRRVFHRRASAESGALLEKRLRKERRLDADWRFSLIRRQMNSGSETPGFRLS